MNFSFLFFILALVHAMEPLPRYNWCEEKLMKYCSKGKSTRAGILLRSCDVMDKESIDLNKILVHPDAAQWSDTILRVLFESKQSKVVEKDTWVRLAASFYDRASATGVDDVDDSEVFGKIIFCLEKALGDVDLGPHADRYDIMAEFLKKAIYDRNNEAAEFIAQRQLVKIEVVIEQILQKRSFGFMEAEARVGALFKDERVRSYDSDLSTLGSIKNWQFLELWLSRTHVSDLTLVKFLELSVRKGRPAIVQTILKCNPTINTNSSIEQVLDEDTDSLRILMEAPQSHIRKLTKKQREDLFGNAIMQRNMALIGFEKALGGPGWSSSLHYDFLWLSGPMRTAMRSGDEWTIFRALCQEIPELAQIADLIDAQANPTEIVIRLEAAIKMVEKLFLFPNVVMYLKSRVLEVLLREKFDDLGISDLLPRIIHQALH